jgi:uncharacterized protein (DUF2147 family)
MRDEMQEAQTPSRRVARLAGLAVVFLLGFAGMSAAKADNGVEGWWVDQTGKAGIIIAPCGASLCGTIKWLREPLDPAGKPKTDIHNPNVALRSRGVCGLAILGNFTSDGSGGYTGGWVYDPDSGNTYKSHMHVAADGKLHVRGYIGISLLGRTEIMTRPAAPLPPCAPG